MDLLYFLAVLVIGFVLFISIVYFLAKLMFPKLREEDEGYSMKRNLQSTSKNPYSF